MSLLLTAGLILAQILVMLRCVLAYTLDAYSHSICSKHSTDYCQQNLLTLCTVLTFITILMAGTSHH